MSEVTTDDRRSRTAQVIGSLVVAAIIVVATIAIIVGQIGVGLDDEEFDAREERRKERQEQLEERREERQERLEESREG